MKDQSTYFDLRVMRDGGLAVLCWDYDLPYAERISLHWMALLVPVICIWSVTAYIDTASIGELTEVTNQECLGGIGCPFSVYDVVCLVDIEAELLVTLTLLVMGYGPSRGSVLC